MSEKGKNTLKYNHGEKSIKVLFVTYADTEPSLEKRGACHSKQKKSSTMKVNKHIPCDYSFSTL